MWFNHWFFKVKLLQNNYLQFSFCIFLFWFYKLNTLLALLSTVTGIPDSSFLFTLQIHRPTASGIPVLSSINKCLLSTYEMSSSKALKFKRDPVRAIMEHLCSRKRFYLYAFFSLKHIIIINICIINLFSPTYIL